eukprot:10325086-Ditylum_brightwellii.AAC.1
MSNFYNLNTRFIDFVLAYPQVEIKSVIYLHPPAGVIINNHGQDLVLKLEKNLYGLKDAGRTWWKHLSSGLEEMGFKQGVTDQCVWKRDGIIITVYVDDCLVFGNDIEKVDGVAMEISKRFEITDEGETIEEYLGIKIDHNQDGNFRMYQPVLIERIIASIPGMDRSKEHKTPAETTQILTKDTNGCNKKEY